MANPAELLYTMLDRWQPQHSQGSASARGVQGVDDAATWALMRVAASHVQALSEVLAGMAAAGIEVAHYQRCVPRWTAAVFAYPRGWGQVGVAEMKPNDMILLQALGERLNQVVPGFTQANRDDVASLLKRVAQAVDADSSLSQEVRQYVARVCMHLKYCVENYEQTGDFELRRTLDQLLVAVGAAETMSSDSTRWQKVRDNFVYPFFVNASVALPSLLAQLALTPTA